MPNFTQHQLQKITADIFEARGVPSHEASIVAELLVASNLAGHDSHGVIRIPQYIGLIESGLIQPGAPMEIERESASHALINGNWGFGHVIAQKAMSLAIEKAKSSTISAISVYNCNHIGRIGSYPLMAAEAGMVGITMVNAGGTALYVAPFGGRDGRLATNPIAIATPTRNGHPILLDITSSVVAQGKIRVAVNRGDSVPLGWLINNEGEPTQNPRDLMETPPGALLPLGGIAGHKGYALGLMIDILGGALSGAGCSGSGNTRLQNGVLMIALDIANFTPLEDFYDHVDGLVDHVKAAPTAPGFEEILTPGEIEARQTEDRLREGIPIDDETWRQIQETAAEVGIPELEF
ncbi:Ldh family oxidoreductase [Candidatus Poribacteria bacterium]|nr:Ldh family oxidoreductase [Candidatus Poribacteria bacterium]MYK16862.1 Ldh family oxidoreductase [Candidatus Poribacteria bacterium]